jgi:hypothetical protein
MSVETNDLLLGDGELFIKKEGAASSKYLHVGTLKGAVQFIQDVTTVEQKPGNRLAAVRRDKTGEKVSLKAHICNFKMEQLLNALGQSVSATGLTVSATLRCVEEILFGSTTVTKTLLNPAVSLTNIVIHSLDRATKYVRGTHFTVPSTAGVKPISATFANKGQMVAYDTKHAGAKRITFGDSLTLQVFSLKYVHQMANKKFLTIEIPRCTVKGDLTLPFNEKEYTEYDITFEALGDTTKVAGQSLYKIIREA